MVGGGDRDGVDALVVEHPAKVGQSQRGGGRLASLLPEHREGAAEHLRVGIDDGRDLDVVEAHEAAQVGLTAAVEAEHGDTDAVVGTPHRGRSTWRREQQRSSGYRRGEKPAAGRGILHPAISLWGHTNSRIITNRNGRMRLCVGMGFRSIKPPLCRPLFYRLMGYDRESLGEAYRPHETPTAHRSE